MFVGIITLSCYYNYIMYFFIVTSCTCIFQNKDRSDDDDGDSSDGCSQRSDMELKEMLGPAFNGRYMSVERPAEGDSQTVITEQPEETGEKKIGSDIIINLHQTF